MKYFFAPVQGHTDAAYRHFHQKTYGNENLIYTTPFIRLERGGIRQKDLKDLFSHLNENIILKPQIIFRNEEEFKSLIDLLKEKNVSSIDLNMGCPFPLQTGHGRGAATVSNEKLVHYVVETINENPDINFSVKIRLGLNDPNEWKVLLPILNQSKIEYLTVHPRVAKQQYTGELYMNEFAEIYNESKNPIIYNGDLTKPEDVFAIKENFPEIAGIMIGRGALGRPSIFNEIISGEEWDKEKRLSKMLEFHRELYNYYYTVLQGETQILSKIKPFWEYAEEEIGRKTWKQIKKSISVPKYNTALGLIKSN